MQLVWSSGIIKRDNLRSKCDWCDYHATLKETSNYLQIVYSSGIIKNDIKLRNQNLSQSKILCQYGWQSEN